MTLKALFIQYVEKQRAANEYKTTLGTDDIRTVDEYQEANDLKRKILIAIEKIEGPD